MAGRHALMPDLRPTGALRSPHVVLRCGLLWAVLVVLAGCGGGGGAAAATGPDTPAPPPAPPAGAEDPNDEDDSTSGVGDDLDQDGLPLPNLQPFDYEAMLAGLPAHFTGPVLGAVSLPDQDNTPPLERVTNAGANLGRVLFYDRRLSSNEAISCASCHRPETGFSDPRRFSIGLNGATTGRHAMGLANLRWYAPGRFFWDEHAPDLPTQVLEPLQDPDEMDMPPALLETKLAATSFYPALFEAAFSSPQITADRVALALAQFLRSMVSYRSPYDEAFAAGVGGVPDFAAMFDAQERVGLQLFGDGGLGLGLPGRSVGCDQCHATVAQVALRAENSGLDLPGTAIPGADGRGVTKSPSLRNVAVRGFYMHDGRFDTLAEVIDFYDTGVQDHPSLSRFLRVGDDPAGAVERLNLTVDEKSALVAFLQTLTDRRFLAAPAYRNPFL